MAALVSWWRGPGGHEGPSTSGDGAFLLSATIITREAHGELAGIHDRTTVMLRRETIDAWLDTDMDERHDAQAWILEDAHLLDAATHGVREEDPSLVTVGTQGA